MTTTKNLLLLATCCFVACASLQISTKEKAPMNWMFYESSGMLLPAQEQSLHPMGPSHKETPHDRDHSKHNGSHREFKHGREHIPEPTDVLNEKHHKNGHGHHNGNGTVHSPHHMKPLAHKQPHGHRNHLMQHEASGHRHNHSMDHEAQKHFKEGGHPHFPRPTSIPEMKHFGHKEHMEHAQKMEHLNDMKRLNHDAHHKEHSQANKTHHQFREESVPKPTGLMRGKGHDHKKIGHKDSQNLHSYHHLKPSSVPQERHHGQHDHSMEHETHKQFKNGHSHFPRPTNVPEKKHKEHGNLETEMDHAHFQNGNNKKFHHKENSKTNESHYHQLHDRHKNVPEPTGVVIAKRNGHKNFDGKNFKNMQSRLHHLKPTSLPNEPHHEPHAKNKGYFRFPKPTTVPEMRMHNGPAHKQN